MNEYQIEQATTRREQQEAALYRADGSKVYGEQEHKERVRAMFLNTRHLMQYEELLGRLL